MTNTISTHKIRDTKSRVVLYSHAYAKNNKIVPDRWNVGNLLLIYFYYYDRSSDDSHSLVPLDETFTAEDGKQSPFIFVFFDKKQTSFRQLLPHVSLFVTSSRDNAFLTTTIMVSLSPVSNYIYPTCLHNTHSLPLSPSLLLW